MVQVWTHLLLLGCTQALRTARTDADKVDWFWSRRRKPVVLNTDENGCAGAACASLDSTEFDFVVVGSGCGGGTVAARLVDTGYSVLVLEAGIDAGDKLQYQIPVNHPVSTETEGLAWNFFVKHYSDAKRGALDNKMTDKGIMYPRGGTLGGSTAVNAMITVLPQVSDWERMAALTGDDSFKPSSMQQFEDLLDAWLPKQNLPLPEVIGSVFNPELSFSALGRLVKSFDAALDEIGAQNPMEGSTGGDDEASWLDKLKGYSSLLFQNVNDKLRDGNVEGPYAFPQMIRNGHRHGTRERLVQALETGKLTIKTHALVDKVIFSNSKADGGCNGICLAKEVLYLDGRGLYEADQNPSSASTPGHSRVKVREGGEIILSAGVYNTPQILKQSGVGAKEELERFDIPVHVDLVGVGENMQDRYEVTVESQYFDKMTDEPLNFVSPDDCNYAAEEGDLCFQHWNDEGKGLYATNGAILSLLKRSGKTDASDLHIFGLPGPFRGYRPGYSSEIPKTDTRNVLSWVILKAHTNNRGGTVKLQCAREVNGKCVVNPRAQPDINYHYFDEGIEYDELDTSKPDTNGEDDLTAVVRAIEFVRRIERKTNDRLDHSIAIETWPGDSFALGEKFSSETERVREFVRREAWGHHGSCSVPMGCVPAEENTGLEFGGGVCKGTKFNQNTVLDSRFRVRGTQGLRVVDASAWPRIPGTFLLLPTFMLSEKGAAAIIEEHAAR